MKSYADVLLVFSFHLDAVEASTALFFSPRSVFSSFPGEKETLKQHLNLDRLTAHVNRHRSSVISVWERANIYACLQGLCGLLPLPEKFVCVCEKRQKGHMHPEHWDSDEHSFPQAAERCYGQQTQIWNNFFLFISVFLVLCCTLCLHTFTQLIHESMIHNKQFCLITFILNVNFTIYFIILQYLLFIIIYSFVILLLYH